MPLYPCYFCNKYFSQKGNLRNHLRKKYKCEFKKYDIENNLKTYISREDLIIMFESDEYHNLFSNSILHPNCTQIAPKCTQIAPKCTEIAPICTEIAPICTEISKKLNDDLKCQYCNMVFTRKSSKKRHINENHCKFLKENITNTNITNNIIINNETINNTTNNTTNNITINCYGKEDLSYITNDMIKDIIEKPLSGIPKLVEMIHLNPNHPENNNIKLVNKNLPFLNYYNGQFWKTGNKSTVLGNLLKSKTALTDKYFEDVKDDNLYKNYPKYSDAIKYVVNNFEFKDPLLKFKPSKKEWVKIYKKLEKDIYTLILNHKEFVKEICVK